MHSFEGACGQPKNNVQKMRRDLRLWCDVEKRQKCALALEKQRHCLADKPLQPARTHAGRAPECHPPHRLGRGLQCVRHARKGVCACLCLCVAVCGSPYAHWLRCLMCSPTCHAFLSCVRVHSYRCFLFGLSSSPRSVETNKQTNAHTCPHAHTHTHTQSKDAELQAQHVRMLVSGYQQLYATGLLSDALAEWTCTVSWRACPRWTARTPTHPPTQPTHLSTCLPTHRPTNQTEQKC